MKNRSGISVLSVCILLAASGCGAREENDASYDVSTESTVVAESVQEGQTESDIGIESEAPSDDCPESAVVAESDQEGQTDPCDYYEELIAAARECVEGKVEEEPEDYYDFSYIIYRYGAHYGVSMGLGYLIEDIDGNGTDELIFGQTDEWNSVIYDLYTISDGKLVHVFSGGERDRYYLCENGAIANEGADSAYVSISAYYIFEGTELHLVEAILCNGSENCDNPWFYSTQTNNPYDTENATSVREEQVRTTMEKYVYVNPTFIPFVEESFSDESLICIKGKL